MKKCLRAQCIKRRIRSLVSLLLIVTFVPPPALNFNVSATTVIDGVKEAQYTDRHTVNVTDLYSNPGGVLQPTNNSNVSGKVSYSWDDTYFYFYITATPNATMVDFKLDPDPDINTPTDLNTTFNANNQTDGHIYFRIQSDGTYNQRTGGAKGTELLNNIYYSKDDVNGYVIELKWYRAYAGNTMDTSRFRFNVNIGASSGMVAQKGYWNYYSGLVEIKLNGIDGVRDNLYKNSYDITQCFTYASAPIANTYKVSGQLYYAWDDDYLYFYVNSIDASYLDLRIDPDPSAPIVTDQNTEFQAAANNASTGDTYIRVNSDGTRSVRSVGNKNAMLNSSEYTYVEKTDTGLLLEMKWPRKWNNTIDTNSFKFTVNLGAPNGSIALKTAWTWYAGQTEVLFPKASEIGDTSFEISTAGLATNTIYLLSSAVITGAANIMEQDSARLVCSLQGLINRDFEKNKIAVYLNRDSQDTFWMNYLKGDNKLLSGMNTVNISTFDQFLNTFRNQLIACGMILWDPNVPATANAAGTICGLDGYLPVKYDTASTGLHQRLLSLGVMVKQNLVGKFTGTGTIPDTSIASTGSKKCDVYYWAMELYMDRCSTKYIAYVPDGAGCVTTNPIYAYGDSHSAGGNCIFNHDYFIARRCFFFDLTCVNEAPCDEPNQPVGKDLATLKAILQKRYDLAGGAIGQCIGFVPWWIKYTTFHDLGSLAPTTVEWMYSDLITAYNVALEADAAHPTCMTNASVYYKSPKRTQYVNNRPSTTTTFDSNTIYCLYYMGDYDSSAWLKKYTSTLWSDSNRSYIPCMWAFNPNLSDRVPMIFDYLYENKLSTDYFVTGDSGAGYIMPTSLFAGNGVRTALPSGDIAWKNYCKPYMDLFQLDVTGFIINGNYTVNNNVMSLYKRISPVGSFHNDMNNKLSIYYGTPYIYLQNSVGDLSTSVTTRAQTMYRFASNTMSGYNFAAFRTICYTPSDIKELTEEFLSIAAANNPSKKYKFVDVYTFFDLIKQSGQGTIIGG